MSEFERHIKALIRHEGPISVATYMGFANRHYYATRDPLGTAGDFTTAPEISQVFGELIGLCLVDFWERSGAPATLHLVELGPGRGTLMVDLLRAARMRPAFLEAARIRLVETSPALRARQKEALADHAIAWADTLDDISDDAPLYLVANEFFDALPIRQFVKQSGAWHERLVGLDAQDHLTFALSEPLSNKSVILGASQSGEPKDPSLKTSEGTFIAERNEVAADIARHIGARLNARGGLALIIDYGHAKSAPGETLQAVRRHAFANPLDAPGEADLTAHVDFEGLATASAARAHGPATQADFLAALGIAQRAATLARARPAQAGGLQAAVDRLTASDQMGTLFKVLALTGPDAPIPAGFALS